MFTRGKTSAASAASGGRGEDFKKASESSSELSKRAATTTTPLGRRHVVQRRQRNNLRRSRHSQRRRQPSSSTSPAKLFAPPISFCKYGASHTARRPSHKRRPPLRSSQLVLIIKMMFLSRRGAPRGLRKRPKTRGGDPRQLHKARRQPASRLQTTQTKTQPTPNANRHPRRRPKPL